MVHIARQLWTRLPTGRCEDSNGEPIQTGPQDRRPIANDTSSRQVRPRAEQKLTGTEATARDKPNPSQRRFTVV